jgi:hypothetical protein
MAEESAKTNPSSPRSAGHMPISEEMDSPRRTLPPILPVVIVLVVIGVIVAIVNHKMQTKPGASGALTGVYAAEAADKSSTMVLIQVRVSNIGNTTMWVRDIKAQLKTDQGELSDDAASPLDFARYFQAFPALASHQSEPLKPETKIAPGGQAEGMVLVSFPVSKDKFDQRKSLSVILESYDRRPMVIAENRSQ